MEGQAAKGGFEGRDLRRALGSSRPYCIEETVQPWRRFCIETIAQVAMNGRCPGQPLVKLVLCFAPPAPCTESVGRKRQGFNPQLSLRLIRVSCEAVGTRKRRWSSLSFFCLL